MREDYDFKVHLWKILQSEDGQRLYGLPGTISTALSTSDSQLLTFFIGIMETATLVVSETM